MKKWLCLLLTIVMMFSLAGCSKKQLQQDGSLSESEQSVQQTDHISSFTVNQNIDFTAQCIRTDGYIEGEEYPKLMWLTSQSEFKDYYEANKDKYNLDCYGTPGETETLGFLDALASYDDNFFENQDLIMVILEEPSGSIRHQVQAVQLSPSNLNRIQYFVQPVIERVIPEAGTCDMAEWHILIAISKEYGFGHSDLQNPIIK